MPIRVPLALSSPRTPTADALQQERQTQQVNDQYAQDQDFIAQQQKEQARIQQAQEAAAADAARAQKAAIAAAKRSGAVVAPDSTGTEQIQRHEDGQPVYQAGFIGTPQVSDKGGAAKYRDARGRAYEVPFDAIRTEQDPAGETFYSFDVTGEDGSKQTMRQPAGTKPLFRVDPTTGNRLADMTDPATGSVRTQVVGIDRPTASKAAIAKRRDALQLRQNEISGEAAMLSAQQQAKETDLAREKARLKEAQDAWEKIDKSKERFERTEEGLFAVSSLGEGVEPMRRKVESPAEIAKADSWLKTKAAAESALAAVKATHDPLDAEVFGMQKQRDQLAIRLLEEKRRAEKEIRLLDEAAKKNYPVYEPEWQKRFQSILADPRVQDNATIADLEAAGDPLAEDVKRVSRPASAAALNAALEAGIVSPNSPLVMYRTTDTKGMMEDAPRANLAQTLEAGLAANNTAATGKDAQALAAQALGITDLENWSVAPSEFKDPMWKVEGGAYDLAHKGEIVGQIDPVNSRILFYPPGQINDATGKLRPDRKRQQEMLAAANKDGLPIYYMGGATPMKPQELRDLIQTGVNIAMGAKGEADVSAKLDAAGLSIQDLREHVRSGRMSVQDGRMLSEKFHGVTQQEASPEVTKKALNEWLAKNPRLANQLQRGDNAAKSEVLNYFADDFYGKRTLNILQDREGDAEARAALLAPFADKGNAAVNFAKEVLAPMVGMLGQFAWRASGADWIAPTEAVELAGEDFDNWKKRSASVMHRLTKRWEIDAPIDRIWETAPNANPGDDVPVELADALAEAAYTTYHQLTPESARELNTTKDTFNINKDPMLRAAWQRYLSTADPTAKETLRSFLLMDSKDRATQAKVLKYIESPRVATADELAERGRLMGLQITPDKAASLMQMGKELEQAQDATQAQAIAKRVAGTLGIDAQEVERVLPILIRKATTDPQSITGLVKGGFAAGTQEMLLEAGSTALEVGITAVTAGAATPAVMAERAAKTGIKAGIQRSLRRTWKSALDGLSEESGAFARARTRLGVIQGKIAADTATNADAWAKAGIVRPTFGAPLTGMQKARNAGVTALKTGAASAPAEMVEEGLAGIGEVDASIDGIIAQMGMGAAGAFLLGPIFTGANAIVNFPRQQAAKRAYAKNRQKWAEDVNLANRGVPGFKPVTANDMDMAYGLMGTPEYREVALAYAQADQVHNAEQSAFEAASMNGPAIPPPSLLAAKAALDEANANLTGVSSIVFEAMDKIRALPESERVLYTAAAKAAAGATDYTEAEAKALMQQSGANAVIFQQAQTLPANVQGPAQLKNLADLPNVTTAAPGVYRLPDGVRLNLPQPLVDMLAQKSPSMVNLMGRGAAPATAQGATPEAETKSTKGKKSPPKANEPNNQTPVQPQQGGGQVMPQPGNVPVVPQQPPAQTPPPPDAAVTLEEPMDNAPAALPQDLDAKLAALTKGGSVSFSKAEKDTVNASWGEASPFNVPEAFKKGLNAEGKPAFDTDKGKAVSLPMRERFDDDSPVAKEEVLFIVEAIAEAEMQRRNTLAKRRLVLIGGHIANDGGAAYLWETDNVLVNPQRLARMVWAEMLNAGKSPTRRLVAEQARGVITHEIVHAAQFEAARLAYSKIKGDKPAFGEWVKGYYENIWNSLNPEQQQATIAAYGTILANAPEWHRGAEASRMLLETGTTGRMSEAVIRHLENVLAVLKRWYADVVAGKADNEIVADEIERVQAVLEAWNNGITVKPDAKKKPAKAKEQKQETAKTPKSSTQFTLSPADAKPILDFGASIPKDELFTSIDPEWSDGALETEPHVTVLYGLTKHEAAPVAKAIKDHGPVTVTLGKLSIFENGEYDVLKVDVEGPGLRALNAKLTKLPHESSFPDYKPHMTIAYLKKGEGKKYVGDTRFEGQTITFDTMTFSPPSELRGKLGKPELPLTPSQAIPPATTQAANEEKQTEAQGQRQEVLNPSPETAPESEQSNSDMSTGAVDGDKKPWQMTRDEFIEKNGRRPRGMKDDPNAPKTIGARISTLPNGETWNTDEHGQEVYAALLRGENVPADVMAEYPMLQDANTTAEAPKAQDSAENAPELPPVEKAPPGSPELAKPTIAADKHYLFDTQAGDVAGMTEGRNVFIVAHLTKLKDAKAALEKINQGKDGPARVEAWLAKPKKEGGKVVSKWAVFIPNVTQDFVDEFNAIKAKDQTPLNTANAVPESNAPADIQQPVSPPAKSSPEAQSGRFSASAKEEARQQFEGLFSSPARVDKSTSEGQSSPYEPGIDSPAQLASYDELADTALDREELAALTALRERFGSGVLAAHPRQPLIAPAQTPREKESRRGALSGFQKLSEELRAVFGKRVLFVKRRGKPLPDNGYNVGTSRNVLAVDIDAVEPVSYLVGHELGHAIEAQSPGLYRELSVALLEMAGDTTAYRARLTALGYKESELDAEIINDFIGSQFMEPAFWRDLAGRDKSLFERMAAAAVSFIQSILRKAAVLSRDVRPLFAEIDKARALLVEVLTTYATDAQFPQMGALAGELSRSTSGMKQQPIPADRLPGFIKLAQTLIAEGVRTPQDLAAFLEETFPGGKARPFSQALWNAVGMVSPDLSSTPDWRAVYAELDRPITQPLPNESLRPEQTPQARTKPKRKKLGKNPLEPYDLLDWLSENKIAIPPMDQRRGKGEYEFLEKISPYYRQFITVSVDQAIGANTPDAAAQSAFDDDARYVTEPTADSLGTAILAAIGKRVQMRAEVKRAERSAKEQADQRDRFNKDKEAGAKSINIDTIHDGDQLVINGEVVDVIGVEWDEDGATLSITLRNGAKYGVQSLARGEALLVDEFIPAQREALPPDAFSLDAETDEQTAERLRREEQQRRIQDKQNAPLTGTAGEFGTSDMFDNTAGPMALFNQGLANPAKAGDTSSNDSTSSSNLERDQPEAGLADASGTSGVQSGRQPTRDNGKRVDAAGAGSGNAPEGGAMPSDVPAALGGDTGNSIVRQPETRTEERPAGDTDTGRSSVPDVDGVEVEQRGQDEPATPLVGTIGSTHALGTGGETRFPELKASAPALTEDQAGDVAFVEKRLATKPGVLLTNGTGTGKTFSGLGVVKRMLDAGKQHILIVAPSDKVVNDWIATAKEFFGIQDVGQLESIQDNGTGNRVVVTTYANMGQNAALVNRPWDAVVTDEAHYLSQSKDGNRTNALDSIRALTLHRSGAFRYAEMALPQDAARLSAIQAMSYRAREELADEADAIRARLDAKRREYAARHNATAEADRPKVVMLSATPFAYHFSLDYAEGYLFDFPPENTKTVGRYNHASPRSQFYIENFGYRMRTGKLTAPENATATGILERRFAEKLMREGAMSGRSLQVAQDYGRHFVLTESELGTRVDEIMDAIQKNDYLRPLAKYIGLGDYLERRYLLEALKARESVERIKQHLALGRKVVVFHDYKKGGSSNPLAVDFPEGMTESAYVDGKQIKVKLADALEALKRAVPHFDDTARQLNGLLSPLQLLEREFSEIGIFNGDVPAKQRRAVVDAFNTSGGSMNVILVQRASGKEGISLHDRDGRHQRVFIDLGIPGRPTDAIQSEGRIYRHGVQSNAIVEYLTTGTSFERHTFAQTIAQRASTAENLAMGERARALLQSFATGYMDAETMEPGPQQGTGGKAKDAAVLNADPFRDAVALYYTNAKKTSRNKSSEGIDYFATPEPLGFKMVEWASIRPGEKVLEPSAGHGAIARFFPDSTNRHAVEPSNELAGRLALNATDVQIHEETFENYHIGNKFDAIVMNPPFGTAGKTAMDHVIKATKHLRNGGRIVALIPEGSSMEKRFDKWMESDEAQGIYLVAEYGLPPVTFERAGTSVKARVVVLDKTDDPTGIRSRGRRDLTGATVQEFFDAIKESSAPDRAAVARLEKPAQTEEIEPAAMTRDTVFPKASVAEPNTFQPAETWHAKKGKPTYVAKISRRLSNDEYAAAKATATRFSGYYSKYDKAGAIPGFQFDTAEDRDAFLSAAMQKSDAGNLSSAPVPTMPRDRAEAIVRNLTPKEQAGKLNPREREAINEARMSLASAPAPGSNASMASASGAAQSNEPSPGGLSEAEAFHGSNVKSPQFDLQFLLSGEGRLGFGPGFSFTEWRPLAESYQGMNGEVVRKRMPPKNQLIDWNAPLETQSKLVNDLASKYRELTPSSTGEELFDAMLRRVKGNPEQKQIALLPILQTSGLKGVVYDNVESLKAPDSVRNYTIWDTDYLNQSFNPSRASGGTLASAPARSVTAEQDAAYMAAVEAGDMEKAQRMVDEAAKAAGYEIKGWHGSPDARFLKTDPVFRQKFRKTNVQWFAKDRRVAVTYADDRRAFDYQNAEPATVQMFLRFSNPMIVQAKGQHWRDAQQRGKTSDVIEEAQSKGHDGVIIIDVQDDYQSGGNRKTLPTTTYATFSAEQIKSADPVTSDEAGNVIPLSQRFNPESDSILYSAPSRKPSKLDAQTREILESMPPPWRDVLQDHWKGRTIEQIAEARGMSLASVGFALRMGQGRFQVLMNKSAAKPTVQVEDGVVKATSGRPDLAMSGNAIMAAVDQQRMTPEEVTHAEMQELAVRMFNEAPEDAETLVRRYLDSNGTDMRTEGMSPALQAIVADAQARNSVLALMMAAGQLYTSRKTMSGNGSTLELVRLGWAWRDVGTETARALSQRQDPFDSPEERAAYYLQDALLTPPESIRNELRRNPANKERILAAWAARADQIKQEMLAEGIDLDVTFREFAKEQQMAEETIPEPAKPALRRAPKKTRQLVKAIAEGLTLEEALSASGMTPEQANRAYAAFRAEINTAANAAASQTKDELLRSAPAPVDFAANIGLPAIDFTKADLKKSAVENEKTRKLKEQRERKKAAAEIDLRNRKSRRKALDAISTRKSNAFDKLSEFWRASILSGPQTHVVNLVSGLTFGTYEATFKKLATGAQADIARMFGLKPDAASLADVPAMISAVLPSIKEAFLAGIGEWQTQSNVFDAYAMNLKDADGESFKESYAPALKGILGKIMRGISFRAMGAADAFVKSFFTRIEVVAQARQIARNENLTGEALRLRIAELTNQRGSVAWERALAQAKRITFQNEEVRTANGTIQLESPLTAGSRAIDTIDGLANLIARTKKGDFGKLLKGLSHFTFPFVDTPTNIFKMGVTMSPVGGLLAIIDATRSLMRRQKGNAEEAAKIYNAARALDDLTNQLVAWGFILGLSELVKPGDDDEELPWITGTIPWRSTSPGEREIAYRTAPPQSIRIGGQWVSYKRLDPFASSLAFTVDAIKEFQSGKPIDEVWTKIGLGMMRNMQDKTFLQGVSDVVNAVQDPERFGTKWATNIAIGFIPNLIRQPIRTADPLFRESDQPNDMGFWDSLGRRVGYGIYPQGAAPAVDIWGREAAKNTGTGGPNTDWMLRLFSPLDMKDADNVDLLDRALLRYNYTHPEEPFGVTAPSREITRTIGGQQIKVSLDDAEYTDFTTKAGKAARSALGDRYNRDLTERDVEDIKGIIQKVQGAYRNAAFVAAVQKRGGVNSILAK